MVEKIDDFLEKKFGEHASFCDAGELSMMNYDGESLIQCIEDIFQFSGLEREETYSVQWERIGRDELAEWGILSMSWWENDRVYARLYKTFDIVGG